MERWNNKIAVVTGASSGIGAATSKALVANGLIVVGLDRQLEKMETQVKASIPAEYQANFHCHKCDVSDQQSVKEAFAWIVSQFGGVDVLVNNAGIMRQTTLLAEEDNSEIMCSTVNTNILGPVWCTREAFRSMKQRNFNGHVVMLSSALAHAVPTIPGFTLNIYPSSKYAVKAMTEVLRQEFLTNETKIKITSISPGCVRTEIVGDEYPEMPTLSSVDIADAIVYCINTPPHVQIHELIIKPMGEGF